ncbi:MAG: hypothetical protein WBA70_07905 [Thermodesulfobacteriota bacterium]
MKTLLNITVFASAVLSIFSTSLTLYEVPVLKESIATLEQEYEVQDSSPTSEKKRVYISYDVSNENKEEHKPIIVAKRAKNLATSDKHYIDEFGVKISNSNNRSNI